MLRVALVSAPLIVLARFVFQDQIKNSGGIAAACRYRLAASMIRFDRKKL
jgi:hypothetical protein